MLEGSVVEPWREVSALVARPVVALEGAVDSKNIKINKKLIHF